MKKLTILLLSIFFTVSLMSPAMAAKPIHENKKNSLINDNCNKQSKTKKHVVNVSVTTLWAEPNKHRKLDQPSLSSPVDMEKWTKNMNAGQKAWLVGKLETQALFWQEVEVLQTKNNWQQIAVKDQLTPKNKKGYVGWVPKNQLIEISEDYEACKLAVVNTQTTSLYQSPSTKEKFIDLSFNTRLPIIKEEKDWLHVQTPSSGIKYLQKQNALVFNSERDIPTPTEEDIVNTAKTFIGLPYLWAGISGFGFDCSGFTHTVYKYHGIMIPRDASVQFQHGVAVQKKNLKLGDLLFFAYNNGKGRVHHVGMYVGNGQMIHSPNSSKSIEIISMNTKPYAADFAGARRYLK